MPNQYMSDDELKAYVKIAIQKGWSKDYLFHRLIAKRKKIGDERLRKMWIECGGPIQEHYKRN